MKLLKDIVQGAGYLEGYGEHPGTFLLVAFIVMGGLAGCSRGGLLGFLGGAAAMALLIGPLWIIGCVGRARDYQIRHNNRAGVSK